MKARELALSLELRTPWMNAAGSLGFAPEARSPVLLDAFGAFVTNPISLHARRASAPPRQLGFPGGVLLHTGHPNPGLDAALKRHAAAWARAPLPIIVHLIIAKPEDLRKAILRVEELDNLMAVELNIEEDSSAELVAELTQAAQGELPIIVQLPMLRAGELAAAAFAAGASAISLGPPRGTLPGDLGKLVSGRLYGPALFPLALETARGLGKLKIPFITAGGVETREQGEAMLAAGAQAVQMDVGLWKNP